MKRNLLFISLFVCYLLSGQSLQIKDSLTGDLLPNVQVKNVQNKVLGITNNSGEVLLNESFQNYLFLSKDGFLTKEIDFTKIPLSKSQIVYLNRESFKLNTLTIEGTKWKSKRENTSSNIFSLGKNDIQFNQPQTTADALSFADEVFIQKSQLGGGSPMIRGFATNRVLIIVDGIRMNNAIFRSGNLQNVIGIDPFSIEQVNAIKGPHSVLYGSDAIGGVLDFTTKEVKTSNTLQLNGNAIVRYSTANKEKTIHADFSVSNDKWSSYSSFSFSDFGDLRMGKNGSNDYLRNHYAIRENGQDVMVENNNPLVQKFSGYKQENFIQKIKFKPNQNFDINYLFSYSNTNNVPRYDRLTRYRRGNLRSAEWYYGPQEWIQNSVRVNLKSKNKLMDDFSSILSHQYFTESRHDRDFGSDSKTNRIERVNVWSWDNAFYKRFNPNNELFYGFDVQLNHINSIGYNQNINTGEKTPTSTRYPDKSNWNQYGIYLKDVWKLNQNINLESGVRYSYVNSNSKFDNSFYNFPFDNADFSSGALSGNIGSTIKLNRGTNLKINLATGFRAPNMDDLSKVFDSEPGSVVVPNPNIKPEYLYSAEAGISKKFGDVLLLNLNGYYSWLENALVRRDFSLNGNDFIMYDGELSRVQAIQNAAKAYVYGGLFAMELNLTKSLKFFGNINYTHGQEELDDGSKSDLRHVAPIFGRAMLTFERDFYKFSLETRFNGKISAENLPISERSKTYMYALDEEGKPYLPDYTVFDVKSQFKINKNLRLNLGLENIFDKRYRPYSSGISAPGRNFVISVQSLF